MERLCCSCNLPNIASKLFDTCSSNSSVSPISQYPVCCKAKSLHTLTEVETFVLHNDIIIDMGSNGISTILQTRRGLKIFWFLDGKDVVDFWRWFRVSRDSSYKFYFMTLISILASWNIKQMLFLTYVFSLFDFIKSFFNSVFYIINGLFKRKSV